MADSNDAGGQRDPRSVPDWELPPGVPRAIWEYAHLPHIAREYDDSIQHSGLARFDSRLLAEWFPRPGRLIDLGCGSGRHSVQFALRGFDVVAVDLSGEMLKIVRERAESAGVSVETLHANLCELDQVPDGTFDFAICMFATLGMIAGPEARLTMLRHVRRLLKPGGQFALHVHNVWFNAFDPQGRRWLLKDRFRKLLGHADAGDKRLHDRGVPHMYMHVFSRRELLRQLREAGFTLETLVPLRPDGEGPLRFPHGLGSLRANGWIVRVRA